MHDLNSATTSLPGTGAFAWFRVAIVAFVTMTLVACGSDDDTSDRVSSSNSATKEDVCQTIDSLSEDLDQARDEAESGNVTATQEAINEAQQSAATLREQTQNATVSDQTSQAAADLVQSVDGLETTMRQATQPGANALGVFQQLEIVLPAIVNSVQSLRQSVACP